MVRFLKSFKYEIKKSLAVFSCWWLSLTSPQSILIAYRISPSHAKFVLYLWKNFVVWFHELKRQYFTEKSYHCHVGFASLNPWGIIRANKDIRSCQFESLGTLLWNEKDFSREKVYKKAICHFGLPSRRSVRMVKIRKWRMLECRGSESGGSDSDTLNLNKQLWNDTDWRCFTITSPANGIKSNWISCIKNFYFTSWYMLWKLKFELKMY